MPTPFHGSYLVCRSTSEVAASPRTIKDLIEAVLDITLPSDLAVSLTVKNESAGTTKLSHLSSLATHYYDIPTNTSRSFEPSARISLSSIYLKVATNNDPTVIEAFFE